MYGETTGKTQWPMAAPSMRIDNCLAGADVDAVDFDGDTPLIKASQDAPNAVRSLIAAGIENSLPHQGCILHD